MTDSEIQAVATTLGLLLDSLAEGSDPTAEKLLREGITGIGQHLATVGGLGEMARMIEIVLDQKPDAESWREGVIDRAWNGIGGWMA